MKKGFLLLFALCATLITAMGQGTQVRGTVSDERGEPVAGARVTVRDADRSAFTEPDGSWAIAVAAGQTLVFDFFGMTSQSVVYNGQSRIDVRLTTAAELVDEVVVIGYQTIRKADLTGAVAVFNPSEMKNTIVTGTVGDALGTLPGVMVRTGGNPGSEGTVEIRGTGTLGDRAPLYVVDGIISGANRDFNFNDIESIQVLKDASAAAIYGSRAGNGVIIITTKQGQEGKMKIDVSSRVTMQWLPRYDLTDRDAWIKLNDLAFTNGGVATANHNTANTDWQDEIFKTGYVQDHNVSFSGGTRDSRYFISGNYQSNSGTTIGSGSRRLTLRSNTSASRDFGDNFRFHIGENITLSHYGVDELNTEPITQAWRMLPTIPVYDPSNPKGGYGYGDGSKDVTFGTNPFAAEDFQDTRNSNLRIRGNAFAGLDIAEMFKYNFRFGFDLSNDQYKYLRKEGDWTYNQDYITSFLEKRQAQYQGLTFDNTLEFNRKFGRHNISAVAGVSYMSTVYERIQGRKTDVLQTSSGEYFDTLDAALNNPTAENYRDLSKLFSAFGRVNYNFDERYLVSFTVRRDESSRFSPENRVGIFPSGSVGWRISNEEFFNVGWVDDLKIRANYGVLGNSNIGEWDWLSFINSYPQAIFGTGQNVHIGMTTSRLSNNDLRWEKMIQANVGFDASLLRNRLSLSVDYFRKVSKDVLSQMQILGVTGNSGGNPYVNAVSLLNTGVEVSAAWRDRVGEVSYNVEVNGSWLKNRITDIAYNLTGGFTQWDTKSMIGHPIGEWYLNKTDGLFRSEAEVQAHKNSAGKVIQPLAKPGDVRFVDFNDDGQINDSDRQYIGSSIPKFQMGMNWGVGWKGFDLQLQWAGTFGHLNFNGPRSGFDRFNDNSNYRADYDPWTPENPNARDPRPIYGDSRNVDGNQDRWLESGNYLRIRQIALGYNVPQKFLGETFRAMRVYVNGQNLVTFTSYTGLDPEFRNSNIWDRSYDGGYYPNPYGVTFGAQITF